MNSGKKTGQKQSIILITEGDVPNIDLSRVFIDDGDHINQIPWEHVYLHKKKRYIINNYNAALANNGTIDIVVMTGADYAAHIVWLANIGGDALITIFRDSTGVSAGSALVPANRNQEAPIRASTVSALLNPTIVGDGDPLITGGVLLPGGTGGAAQGGGGEGRDEFIQPVSTTFLYRLTNVSGQVKKMNFGLDFYEHEPVVII